MTVLQAKQGRPKKMTKGKLLTYKQAKCKNPVKPESNKCKRATHYSIYHDDKVKCAVFRRAQELQANLPPEFPSMIKCMLPSHVTGGFWLGLPKKFCIEHMPKQDAMISLEDEKGVNSQAKYLTEKVGLSGGWRGFSIAHNLVESDVLVFQLVKPRKLKVYIVRVNGSEEVDVALGLLKLEACMKEVSPGELFNCLDCTKWHLSFENSPNDCEIVQIENQDAAIEEIKYPHLMCNQELDYQKNDAMACDTIFVSMSNQSENGSEDLGFDSFNGIRLSDSVVDFKNVKSFEDFDILINGLVINRELSKHLQSKYYELCCSKKSFLHEHLIEGLNLKLSVGVIAEIINIADAIRASTLATPQESFATWMKTLDAFNKLGMNVGFLIERLDQLMNLAIKSMSYKELRDRRLAAEEKMKSLESQLLEIKEANSRLDFEIEQLGLNEENHELMFQEVAKAPW